MSGCGVERAGGSSEESIQFGDMERTYRLAVPKSYDARSPAPLVLNFHGLGCPAGGALLPHSP
jgi:polyhydroxybutyrate depolymerase